VGVHATGRFSGRVLGPKGHQRMGSLLPGPRKNELMHCLHHVKKNLDEQKSKSKVGGRRAKSPWVWFPPTPPPPPLHNRPPTFRIPVAKKKV